jgi:glutamine cyclotransferase
MLVVIALAGLAPSCRTVDVATPVCSFEVIASYPHDAGAFTQGLVFVDGYLYEGTGRHGESSLRRVELATGEVLLQHDLEPGLFGEGIAAQGGRIIQLTWKSGTGFVYDRETFDLLGIFEYDHQGWGLASDGGRLIVSDGTALLRIWDPETFKEIGQLRVHDDGTEVVMLNELEFVGGELLANIFSSDRIARIDPTSGEVVAWIDLGGLLDPSPEGAGVLNGIAFDEDGGRLFVTGKYWPRIFEIRVTGCGDGSLLN